MTQVLERPRSQSEPQFPRLRNRPGTPREDPDPAFHTVGTRAGGECRRPAPHPHPAAVPLSAQGEWPRHRFSPAARAGLRGSCPRSLRSNLPRPSPAPPPPAGCEPQALTGFQGRPEASAWGERGAGPSGEPRPHEHGRGQSAPAATKYGPACGGCSHQSRGEAGGPDQSEVVGVCQPWEKNGAGVRSQAARWWAGPQA